MYTLAVRRFSVTTPPLPVIWYNRGMTNRTSDIKWLRIAVCIALLFASYGVGYVYMGIVDSDDTVVFRIYKSPIVARTFVPAAWVEAKLTRKEIAIFAGIPFHPSCKFSFVAEP